MSGLKITGCSEGMLKALERAQEAMEPKIKNLNMIHRALEDVQKDGERFDEDNPHRLSFGVHSFLVDMEFVGAFEEILLGLYLRKERELQSFEWEIPLAASKPQEPDDIDISDLYGLIV